MSSTERPLVSFIIPIFNTEKFVGRAIESILQQTYNNIEVILVDDGSTDKSGEICKRYAEIDSRVKLVCQRNSGVSAARNAGLDICKGEYVQFVDSDDEIEKKMTETLVNEIKKYNCDIVICGFSLIGHEKKDIRIDTCLYDRNEFLILSYTDTKVTPLVWSSCNMIFKNSYLQENNLRFDSFYDIGEDGLFTLEYIIKCKKVLVLNKIFNNYYRYKKEERVSATMSFPIDIYELRIRYFELLFNVLKYEINNSDNKILLQTFYDQLVAGLVRLGAYFEHFSENEIKQKLTFVVNNKLVIKAGEIYKTKRDDDSILIPLFIRCKSVKFLYVVLKKRGEKYIDKYGKCLMVRSIYKK